MKIVEQIKPLIQNCKNSNIFYFSSAALLTGLFVLQMFSLIKAEEWLDHTDQAISHGILIEKRLVDAETGIRGFLLSSDQRSLKPFTSAVIEMPATLKETAALIQDNPAQLEILQEFETVFQSWAARAHASLKDAPSEKRKAVEYFGFGPGSEQMDRARQSMSAFLAREQMLRQKRVKDLHWKIPRTIFSGAVLSLMLRLLVMGFWTHWQRKKTVSDAAQFEKERIR